MGLFTPDWKKSDFQKRLDWIEKAKLNSDKQREILISLATDDENTEVRLAAVKRIDSKSTTNNEPNYTVLEKIILNEKKQNVKKAAIQQLENKETLERLVKSAISYDFKKLVLQQLHSAKNFKGVISKLSDQATLIEIIRNDSELDFKKQAVERLKEKPALEKLLNETHDYVIKKLILQKLYDSESFDEIIEKIEDNVILELIIENDENDDFKQLALQQIRDKNVLHKYKSDSYPFSIRQVVYFKLSGTDDLESLIKATNDNDTLSDIIRNADNDKLRSKAIDKINDPEEYVEIAKKTNSEVLIRELINKTDNPAIVKSILETQRYREKYYELVLPKINDEELLKNIYRHYSDPRNHNYVQRLKNLAKTALERLPDSTLADMATNAMYPVENKIEAINHITQPDLLKEIEGMSLNTEIKNAIEDRLKELEFLKHLKEYNQEDLVNLYEKEKNKKVKDIILDYIEDQELLVKIILNDSSLSNLVEKIKKPELLKQIAVNAKNRFNRIDAINALGKSNLANAIGQIDDQDTLIMLAEYKMENFQDNNKYYKVDLAPLELLSDKIKDDNIKKQLKDLVKDESAKRKSEEERIESLKKSLVKKEKCCSRCGTPKNKTEEKRLYSCYSCGYEFCSSCANSSTTGIGGVGWGLIIKCPVCSNEIHTETHASY